VAIDSRCRPQVFAYSLKQGYMTAFTNSQIKNWVLGALRHFPRLRLFARKMYWGLKKGSYDRKYKRLPTEPKTVLFESFGGRSITDSPLALYEEMCSRDEFRDWRFIWSIREDDAVKKTAKILLADVRAECVIRGTKSYLQACAQAAYWIVNNRMPEWLEPKSEQVFVQCWHGTPLKRLGFDLDANAEAALNTSSELSMRFLIDAKKWTYLISPSAYTSKHLLSAFGATDLANVSVIEEGYPRNDSIVQRLKMLNRDERLVALKEQLGITESKKVLLYASTFRDSSYQSGKGYVRQESLDLRELLTSLGKDWVVLLRSHYYITNSIDTDSAEDALIDVSQYNDINDLYLIADALMTDYSSVMFDYANTKRPIIYYWPDFNEYKDRMRGFYLDPNALPGPKCVTQDEVVAAIRNLDEWEEQNGMVYKQFRLDFCSKDDGTASKRVLQEVFKV
jgi:CDP-glycerol glycerophosphotransferase